ncbi:hypothetical protein FB451DRAFT_1191336 [Mycena latifolia]|nr:hypothetical protein FB451DRAFT_1191336 [Mycena latifolia]
MHVSRKGETAKVPLLRPLAAGSEIQRDRRHLRAPHEEVQDAAHAARNSKGKGTKPRRDARAAGGPRQRRLGRRPCIYRQARDRDARPPPRREMPTPQNLSHRNMQERTPKLRIPTIEKTKKEQAKIATHPRNSCPLPPQCMALAGVSSAAKEGRTSGAVVLKEGISRDKRMLTDSEGDGWREKRKRWTIRTRDYEGKEEGWCRKDSEDGESAGRTEGDVKRVNENERGQGTSAKDTQSAMEGK